MMKLFRKIFVIGFGEVVTFLDVAFGVIIGEVTKAVLVNKGDFVTMMSGDYSGFIFALMGLYLVLRVLYKILLLIDESMDKDAESEKASKKPVRRKLRYIVRRRKRMGLK